MAEKKIYVSLSGLPLSFELKWPFHKSTSGADFHVLHTDIRLESAEGLHAPVAVNLSETLREVMPSLEPKDAEAVVINALRKDVDKRQIEFVKSGKLVPVHFSSRHYDFKRNAWVFGKATDEDMSRMLARKVYWQTKLIGGPVWVGDPTDALYVQTTVEHLLQEAGKLAAQGSIKLEKDWATATPALMSQSARFEVDAQAALEELEKKHAYERGVVTKT
ncbi:MAG: hypothetical protein ABSE92_10430 [Terriglobales bacterium]